MYKETLQNISLDLIDDPNAPMRSQMDEEKLNELSASIKKHGLIQPITVRSVHDDKSCPPGTPELHGMKHSALPCYRYEVVAGHRRFKASKRAGLAVISAIVRELTDADADGMRMHENLYREDINPVDEARYIQKMVDMHKVAPAELAKMTGKSVAYLQARYDLLEYPDYLLQAVEQENISLTAASWLVRITDDRVRKEYTRFGIIGGITAKRAEAWYQSWTVGSLPREASAFVEPVAEASLEPSKLYMPCAICRFDDDIEKMSMQYAHLECVQAMRRTGSEGPPSP